MVGGGREGVVSGQWGVGESREGGLFLSFISSREAEVIVFLFFNRVKM